MSNPGGKVTNSIFSGPGRRLGDGKEILKSNKRKVSEIGINRGTFSDILKMTEDSDDEYNDYQEGGDVAEGKKRKVS